jgi:dTDP-glucose 4,6-dehydratase
MQIMNQPESLMEYVTDRPGHDVRYAIDWSETHQELGYYPQHTFDEYLRETVTWYQEHMRVVEPGKIWRIRTLLSATVR